MLISLGADKQVIFTDIESPSYDPTSAKNGGISYEVAMASMTAVTRDGEVLVGAHLSPHVTRHATGLPLITLTVSEEEAHQPQTPVTGVPVFEMLYQQVGLGWLFAVTHLPVVGDIIRKSPPPQLLDYLVGGLSACIMLSYRGTSLIRKRHS